jgi:cytochrome b561
MPKVVLTGSSLGLAMGDIHMGAAIAFLGIVAVHTAAAFYHHFYLRDQVLERMLPGFTCRPSRESR